MNAGRNGRGKVGSAKEGKAWLEMPLWGGGGGGDGLKDQHCPADTVEELIRGNSNTTSLHCLLYTLNRFTNAEGRCNS